MNDGLWFEAALPFAWREAAPDHARRLALMREATLFLAALNQMEGMHELEAGGTDSRRLERLEVKLDLTLYLLARALNPGEPPPHRRIRLAPDGAQWADAAPPPEGSTLLLELHPSDALPMPLRLPAVARVPADGLARVAFSGLTPGLDDALHQFVFRRHRQAIRAKGA